MTIHQTNRYEQAQAAALCHFLDAVLPVCVTCAQPVRRLRCGCWEHTETGLRSCHNADGIARPR